MTNGLRARDAAPLTTLACIFMPHCICVTAARLSLPHLTPFLHRDGYSALHLAAGVGHLETVQALVEKGATVNAKNG